jgi:hypothetical protein
MKAQGTRHKEQAKVQGSRRKKGTRLKIQERYKAQDSRKIQGLRFKEGTRFKGKQKSQVLNPSISEGKNLAPNRFQISFINLSRLYFTF